MGQDKAYWLHILFPYDEENAENCVGYLGYRLGGLDSGELRVIEDAAGSAPALIEKLLAAAQKARIAWDESLVISLPLDDRMALAQVVLGEAQKRKAQFFREIPYEHAPAGGVLWRLRPKLPVLEKAAAQARVRELSAKARAAAEEPDYPTAIGALLAALETAVPALGWCELHTAGTVRMLSQMYRATGNFRNEKTALLLLHDMAAGIAATPAGKIPQNDGNYRDFIDLLAEEAKALGDDELRRQYRRHCVAAGGAARPDDETPTETSASDAKKAAMAELEDLLGDVMGMLPVDDLYSDDKPAIEAAPATAETAAAAPAASAPP
ncbi:MAG TPA: hypothetical protein VL860_01645, partial [Planctomycetota bacterium]|nr:hypothetical protein [Planctomycetota bacterium]